MRPNNEMQQTRRGPVGASLLISVLDGQREMRTLDKESCAYCGSSAASTEDHVLPSALYPPSKACSGVPRIKVRACLPCNSGWSDDEVHFRNMLLIAGEPNPAVQELWHGKARRSSGYSDGRRRLRDLVRQMVPVHTAAGERHMVYPGRDERVMRIVRKVLRGLCHHHNVPSPVADAQVWGDVQRFDVHPAFLAEMTSAHAEADILEYRFGVIDDLDTYSSWLLRFSSIEARTRVEDPAQQGGAVQSRVR